MTSSYKKFNDAPSAPAEHIIPADSLILAASQQDQHQQPQQYAQYYSNTNNNYNNNNYGAPMPMPMVAVPLHSVEPEEKICRCCHDTDKPQELIAPCACTGTYI